MSFDDGPNEECNACSWDYVGLDCEKMPDLVNWEPDCRQAEKPEEEEAKIIASIRARASRHGVLQIVVLWPDGSEHERDALSSDPCLYTVPDTGHCCAVEDGPESTPDTEGSSCHNGETDMVCRTDSTGQTNECTRNEIPDPDADPRLPPGQAVDDHTT